MAQMRKSKARKISFEDNLGDKPIPFVRYSISSYGQDFDVDGLVRRLNRGDIFIPPFQRKFVWSKKQSSHFIESLLLGLPVPGIFLAREDNNKLLVIDGQQRLTTLKRFCSEESFTLEDVQQDFENKKYNDLEPEDRRRLDDSLIHATIIKQEFPEENEDNKGIYYVFQRLNTGGTMLRPQDIRAAIYHGKFNELLNILNKNKNWREIFSNDDSEETDLYKRDQELILRFFVLYFMSEQYKTPMEEFLNAYMSYNRHLEHQSAEQLRQLFENTIEIIYKTLGSKAFKPKKAFNAAIFDAVMVGLARRLAKGPIKNLDEVKANYQTLVEDSNFQDATNASTAGIAKVKRRIELATEAFASIK